VTIRETKTGGYAMKKREMIHDDEDGVTRDDRNETMNTRQEE